MPFVHKFLNLSEYQRPADRGEGLDGVLALLARTGIRTVVLAGGDTLLASGDPTVEAVVDLQGLGLDAISPPDDPNPLRIGAMVTRSALSAWGDGSDAGSLPRLLATGADGWGGGVQRNRATVGGAVVAAASNDPLVAAFLACDAEVVLAEQAGERVLPIADFLSRRTAVLAAPAIITELKVSGTGRLATYACETVQRTPADAPIVLAVASLVELGGHCTHARLVVGGVSVIPVRVVEAEAVLQGASLRDQVIGEATERVSAMVNPDGDFRGSVEYRRAMAKVLARRALRHAADGARRGAN